MLGDALDGGMRYSVGAKLKIKTTNKEVIKTLSQAIPGNAGSVGGSRVINLVRLSDIPEVMRDLQSDPNWIEAVEMAITLFMVKIFSFTHIYIFFLWFFLFVRVFMYYHFSFLFSS